MRDESPPRRRSLRLPHYDYAQPGAYFVTACVDHRRHLFGDIVDGVMCPNAFGRIVEEEWFRSGDIRAEIKLDAFIVMPNHVHGIVFIDHPAIVGATGRSPLRRSGPASRSLGSFIAGFKASTTRRINELRQTPRAAVWQRNYWEHIVRDEDELDRIRDYVANNPANWAADRENPAAVVSARPSLAWET